MASK
ncbi:hypothetical protein YPPY47_4704, partial [Yersinia pestis PY-47]|jgi:small nuclear ribonucleoprotein G